jgi:hypothetical protein
MIHYAWFITALVALVTGHIELTELAFKLAVAAPAGRA